ncbi:MAG: hypothetical protein AAF242_06965, partial [Bacteroidota bacterium]
MKNRTYKTLKLYTLFTILVFTNQLGYAQLSPIGVNTLANTTTTQSQRHVATAMNTNQKKVVVWQSYQGNSNSDVYFDVFGAGGTSVLGETFVPNNTNRNERFPDIAIDDAGRFVIAWQEEVDNIWQIFYRAYSASNVGGFEIQLTGFTVPTPIPPPSPPPFFRAHQRRPSISAEKDGNCVLAWQDSFNISAILLDTEGFLSRPEFQIGATADTVLQAYPDAAIADNGDFAVVWQSTTQDGDGTGIYAQLFNASGTPKAPEFRVNSTVAGNQTGPAIAMSPSGEFVVVWSSYGTDGDGEGIYAQEYNADGTTNGSEFRVNTTTANAQDNPDVAMTSDLIYTVVFNTYVDGPKRTDVLSSTYNFGQINLESEGIISTEGTLFQQFPSIAMQATNAIIGWQDGNVMNVSSSRIRDV